MLNYASKKNLKFEKKINKIFWRGDYSGFRKNFLIDNMNYKERGFCVINFWSVKFVDFGITSINQNEILMGGCDCNNIINNYFKNYTHINEQIKYKYLLSIEGNDVATDLKWKLSSNCVVFMRRPTVFSWLMEDKLEEYVHYIPLNDDYSNLTEQYIFAENNQELCKSIIRNANEYMSVFMDEYNEEYLQYSVIKKYLENICISQ